ncbi:MAG TPA: acyl carrier protein [Gemmatimonadaceae bacterium]|jgi:acyl carrier protein
MNDTHTEKLQEVFRVVFELPRAVDVSRVRQKTQENWDSLRHVMLIAALESEFGVRLDTADALCLNSFETAQQLLEGRGVGASFSGS